MLINMAGTLENSRISQMEGTIVGPSEMFVINAAVADNGDGYNITGQGAFNLGPVEGNVTAEISTDSSFNIDPSSLNVSGDATVNTELAGTVINLQGTMENGRLASLEGTIVGPSEMFTISASVTDNGDGYIINGEGAFTAGPVEGTLSAVSYTHLTLPTILLV